MKKDAAIANWKAKVADYNRRHPDDPVNPRIWVRIRMPLQNTQIKNYLTAIRRRQLWIDDHSK